MTEVISPPWARRRYRSNHGPGCAKRSVKSDERAVEPVDLDDGDSTKGIWKGLRNSIAEHKGVFGNMRQLQRKAASASNKEDSSNSGSIGRGRKLKAVVAPPTWSDESSERHVGQPVGQSSSAESQSPTPSSPQSATKDSTCISSCKDSATTPSAGDDKNWEHVFDDLPSVIETKQDRKKKKRKSKRNSEGSECGKNYSPRMKWSLRQRSSFDDSETNQQGRVSLLSPRTKRDCKRRSSLTETELQRLVDGANQGSGHTWGDLAYVQKSPSIMPDCKADKDSSQCSQSSNSDAGSMPDLDIPILPDKCFNSKLMQKLIKRNDSFSKLDEMDSSEPAKELISNDWKETLEDSALIQNQASAEQFDSISLDELIGGNTDDEVGFLIEDEVDEDPKEVVSPIGSPFCASISPVKPKANDSLSKVMHKMLESDETLEDDSSQPFHARNLEEQFSMVAQEGSQIDTTTSFETALECDELIYITKKRDRSIRFADEQGLPIHEVFHWVPNDADATGRLVILMLSPEDRKFEFIHTEYRLNDETTVQDALVQLPSLASNEMFAAKQYSSMFRTRDSAEQLDNTMALQSYEFEKSEVVLGVTDGYDGEEMVKCALPLLMNAKVAKAVKYARRTGRGVKYLMNSRELAEAKEGKQPNTPQGEVDNSSDRTCVVGAGAHAENNACVTSNQASAELVSIIKKSSYLQHTTSEKSSESSTDESKPFADVGTVQLLHAGLVATIGILYSMSFAQ